MEILIDFDQNESHFLVLHREYMYNSAKTNLIHEGGCHGDEKLSLSRVKIVQHGPLTLCFRLHI